MRIPNTPGLPDSAIFWVILGTNPITSLEVFTQKSQEERADIVQQPAFKNKRASSEAGKTTQRMFHR